MPRVDLVKELGRDMLLRFAGEMDAQAELEHNHIVRIRDRGRVEALGLDLPFVVADFKDGGDLEKRLREGKQDLAEVLEWLVPISRALDFSHECGWAHRDVKPDNILYDRQGFVYLSDFGIAKKIETGPDTLPVEGEVPATTFGHVIGTPGYIPPEAVSRDYTAGYDQYSLAVVVVQALTGQRPKAEGAASRVKELLPGVPRVLRKPLLRALAGDPRERFATCRAFAEALRNEALRADSRRRTVWAGAAVSLLTVGAAAWLLVNGGGERDDDDSQDVFAEVVAAAVPPVTVDAMDTPLADAATRSFSLGSTPAERDQAL
jgi:serine/threonine-protein kinase